MKKIKIYKCNRCHYEWIGRSEREPKECPRCKSIWWNRERKYKLRSVEDAMHSFFEEAEA